MRLMPKRHALDVWRPKRRFNFVAFILRPLAFGLSIFLLRKAGVDLFSVDSLLLHILVLVLCGEGLVIVAQRIVLFVSVVWRACLKPTSS
jgi:ABC-type uncharacterized transport system permease subunit